MTYTVKLDYRELTTIGHLLGDKLERGDGNLSPYERRSLVRLALVLGSIPKAPSSCEYALRGAPTWVYAYLGRPLIANLLQAPKPKAKPAAKKAARRSPPAGEEE